MSTDESVRAQQIALEVTQRRASGENISDNDVLSKYPELAERLEKHFSRMRFLDSARSNSGNNASFKDTLEVDFSPPPEAPESEGAFDVGDIRVTRCEKDMGDILRGTQIISDGPIAPGGTPSAPRISRTAPATIFRPHHRKPMGVIKVYHDNQRTFDFVAVRSDAFTIGRQEKNDLAICEDFRMSGQHARIERREVNGRTQFYLVDQNSTNGTFVRADRARLKDGDEILLGAERYQIMIGAEVRLKHIVPTRDGAELLLTGERWLGREFDDGLEAFKSDPMLDPRHARLFQDKSGRWVIQDGKSVNGTWVRVMEVPLLSRCNFQLGEQRFGFLD